MSSTFNQNHLKHICAILDVINNIKRTFDEDKHIKHFLDLIET
jgi:hypothetical protein